MKPKTIDFKGANPYDPLSYLEIIKTQLVQDGLYTPGLLYRGFNAKDISRLLKEGQDTPGELFCVNESQLETALKTGDKIDNALSYAAEHETPAIVVYDGSKMTQETKFVYRLPEPDKTSAIVAVYKLKNFLRQKKAKRQKVTPEQGKIALRELKDKYGIECKRRIKPDKPRARTNAYETRQQYFPFMKE